MRIKHPMHRQEVHMESKAKFLGHPIHPILIVFPLGLLATSAGSGTTRFGLTGPIG